MVERSAAEADKHDRLGEAVERVEDTLRTLALAGLARSSPAQLTELRALVQTAHNAGMVRVERALETLVTTVAHYQQRDPNFRPFQFVDRIDRVRELNRLCRAVHDSGGSLSEAGEHLGVHRRSYVEVKGTVEVQAIGASGWVSDSGFVGVTIELAAPGRVLTASIARPSEFFGDDPTSLYTLPFSEYSDIRVVDLAHGAVRMHQARVSADGRLSMHGGVRLGPAVWRGAAYDAFRVSDWPGVAQRIRSETSPVHRSPSAMVLISPAAWGPVAVDDTRSVARMELLDSAGRALGIRIPLRPEHNRLVENLRVLTRRADLRPPALYGRVSLGRGLNFEPVTAVYGEPIRIEVRRRRVEVDEVHLSLEDVETVRR